MPVSTDVLLSLGFQEPDLAALEIAELANAIFGPFDPIVAAAWSAAAERELSPADLRALLAEAAAADDPLEFLATFPDARDLLKHRMRWHWSSRRARALGHPSSLEGQTWASLSEIAQAEVREGLRELSTYHGSQVRRHRSRQGELDTFLSELAEIYACHAAHLSDPLEVPHSPTSRFIQLAALVLTHLPRRPTGEAWINPNLWTPGALSERWKRIKAHERSGGDDNDGSG